MTFPVYFAYEDNVHREIFSKVVEYLGLDANIVYMRGSRGRAKLEADIPKYNNAAHNGMASVVLADLDRGCPVNTLKVWLGGLNKSDNLIVRFAVMEAEAWLLADYKGISQYLRVDESLVYHLGTPDSILNPKEALIGVAARSRSRDIREDIVPDHPDYRHIGQGYNYRMQEFIATKWDVERATLRSNSLSRFILSLRVHKWS